MKRILILAAALAAVLACRQSPAETTLLTGKFGPSEGRTPDIDNVAQTLHRGFRQP